jgi:molybdate transport system ATP-binding protein
VSLAIDLEAPLAPFTLSVRWESRERFLGIFGHSGAGKTTILEAIAGTSKLARGTVRVNGRVLQDPERGVRLPPEARGVGYVPQDGLLFPHLDVLGNVRFGARRAELAPGRALPPERVLSVLELSGLEGRALGTLSGGERRRVALARALCSGPDLLLLDEPLAGLDAPLKRRIFPYLLRVREEFGIPTVFVSHDPGEVSVLCDEVLVVARGRALAAGPPRTIFARPDVFAIAREEGFENVLVGRVIESRDGSALVELAPSVTMTVAGALAAGTEVTIGLRAEDVVLALERPSGLSAQNALPAVVREIRDPAGDGGPVLLVAEIHGTGTSVVVTITKQAVEQLSLRPGLPLHLVSKAQACRILAARSAAL